MSDLRLSGWEAEERRGGRGERRSEGYSIKLGGFGRPRMRDECIGGTMTKAVVPVLEICT